MRESDAIEDARRALGARLSAYRRAAGHSQAGLARLADCSRNTIANVEIGRQHVPGTFWASVDTVLDTGGALTRASAEIQDAVRAEREEAARQGTRSRLAWPAATVAMAAVAVAVAVVAVVPGRWPACRETRRRWPVRTAIGRT